jgi:DNA-binding transcriptional LysR family regulator
MELRSLLHFLAVAEEGSLSAAARSQNISQPALTKRIRALEDELRIKLFERLPRGMVLTLYGESLAEHARRIRAAVSHADAEMDALRGGRGGTVKVGAGPSWLGTLLPRAISRLHASRPEVRVEVVAGQDDTLRTALRKGDLDFVVAALTPNMANPGLEQQTLVSDDLKVVGRQGHPLTLRASVSLADLLDFPWVLPRKTALVRQRLERLFNDNGLAAPVPAVETDSPRVRLALPSYGDYLTFTASHNLLDLRATKLLAINVPGATWKREAGLTTRSGGFLSPAARALIAQLETVCMEDSPPDLASEIPAAN